VYGGGKAVTNSGVLLFDTVSVHWATQHGDFNTVLVERVVPTVSKDATATATADVDIAAVDTIEAVDDNDQVALADANDSDSDSAAAAPAAPAVVAAELSDGDSAIE
jgi:hypothetical protein